MKVYSWRMGAIQIKNVPEELHAAIRSRAAEEGRTVSEYVLDLIKRDLRTPTMRQWLARVQSREPVEPVEPSIDTVELLHQLRGEREEELARRMGLPPLAETDDAEK